MFEEDVTQVFYTHRPRYDVSNTLPRWKRHQCLTQQLAWSDYGSRITGLRYIYYLFSFVVFKAQYFENNTHAGNDKAKLNVYYVTIWSAQSMFCCKIQGFTCFKSDLLRRKKKKNNKNLDTIKYGELFMDIYSLILHISYLESNYRQWNSFKMAENNDILQSIGNLG